MPCIVFHKKVALELGSYRGYLTRTLAQLFREVVAVEAVAGFAADSARWTAGLANVTQRVTALTTTLPPRKQVQKACSFCFFTVRLLTVLSPSSI